MTAPAGDAARAPAPGVAPPPAGTAGDTREAASRLCARTVALDDAGPDLLAVAGDEGMLFEREGAGLAGVGCALRVRAVDAEEALSAVAVHDEVGLPGCGAVAMGALPFAGAPHGTLVVPSMTVGRAPDGTAWVTTVQRDDDAPPPRGAPPPLVAADDRRRPPDAFTLVASRPHEEWCALVRRAVSAIGRGPLRKVVLAREVVVEANRPLRPADVVDRLRRLYPSCTLFSCDGFVGASPELLVARRGAAVRSHPMAGTIPRSGDPAVDTRLAEGLLASAKDRHEHRLVVDAVAAALGAHCDDLDVPDAPSIVPLRNVSHLGTLVSGRLAPGAPGALGLALGLHPTPAVAGTPADAALAYLAAAEGLDRGCYAGPVGWVDARGDGEWAVGIRSAHLDGSRARLFAGVGVVADSDPEAELAETQLKLQALLAAVVRP